MQSSPNFAFCAVMAGALAVYWELIRPGKVIPGLLGCGLLVWGGYSLSLYPVRAAGLLWIGLALLLLAAELILDARWIGGLTGAAALGTGLSRLLVGTERISLALAWSLSASFSLATTILARSARQARRNKHFALEQNTSGRRTNR